MAYKRQIDRLPIIPKDAKEFNVTCHYCIVGCGYKAYTWPANKQGGTAAGPEQVRRRSRQAAGRRDRRLVLALDVQHRQAERPGRAHRHQARQGLRRELRPRLGPRRPHGRDELFAAAQHPAAAADRSDGLALRPDAADQLGRCARSRRARDRGGHQGQGEDGLFVSAFDHGGAGGGYENTWGTGKLYFGAMKIKNIRIHNRPAYNSEVHATRDMGVGELNNCYEDAELADTIVAVGTNALETQTNYFLNHWVPNLRGTSVDKKKAEFGSRAGRAGQDHHRRSAPHRHGQCLRSRGRQGQCAASRDQFRHRPRAVQCLADLHRRQGLDRQGLHRCLDHGLRKMQAGQQDQPRGCGARSPA